MKRLIAFIKALFQDQNDGFWSNVIGLAAFVAAWQIALKARQPELVWPFIALTAAAFGLNGVFYVVKHMNKKDAVPPPSEPAP